MFADIWASALIVSLDPLKLKQNSPRSVIAREGLGATAIRMTTTSERRGTRVSDLCMWRLPRGVGLSSRQDGRGSRASCPTAGPPAETLAWKIHERPFTAATRATTGRKREFWGSDRGTRGHALHF